MRELEFDMLPISKKSFTKTVNKIIKDCKSELQVNLSGMLSFD